MDTNSNFLYKYQTTKFKENPSDMMKLCFYNRSCAGQMYQEALKRNSTETACLILQQKLTELSALIDDRKSINNFANLAKSLCENITNNSQTWESGLESMPDLVATIPKPVNCSNPSPNGCSSAVPYEDNIRDFFSALENVRKSPYTIPVSDRKPSLIAEYREERGANSDFGPKRSGNLPSFSKPLINKNKTENSLNNPASCTYDMKTSLFSTYKTAPPSSFTLPVNSSISTSKNTHHSIAGSDPSLWEKTSQDLSRFTLQVPGKRTNKANTSKGRGIKFQENQPELPKNEDLFFTAKQALIHQQSDKNLQGNGSVKKSLGGKSRVSSNKFVPPLRNSSQDDSIESMVTKAALGGGDAFLKEVDERLQHIDPKMIENIKSEIIDNGPPIGWDDIAGLDFAKRTIQEIVVWPMMRPDIFTGLRRPPRGILLFGPPGTGKTLIGKCIASQSKSTFFSISASSLTSKWIGDGEKMVKALFAVARVEQPAVVFIDEIDSLLSQRSDTEHESSRRLKTEFLVQLDGAGTGEEDRLLIIGATNRPQELDEAARRRLVKRLYVPLPDLKARKQLVNNLMKSEKNSLTEKDLDAIAELSDGYSGADMKNLCQEACLGPIRSISITEMTSISPDQVRPVSMEDFSIALNRVKSSVSAKDLDGFIAWDKQFGMSSG